jgi:hypothetical protein
MYQIKYNHTILTVETLSESIEIAMQLVDPSMPWDAVISEIDEDGKHLLTIKRIPCNA